MKFSYFLKTCNIYLMDKKNCTVFMYEFFSLITSDDDLTTVQDSPIESETFPAKAKKIYYGQRDFSKKDANFILSHFNEIAFITLIEDKTKEMPDNIHPNFLGVFQKEDSDVDLNNIADKMSKMFLNFIEEMANKKRTYSPNKKKEKKSVSNNTNREHDEIVESEIPFDEETLTLAKKFCIEHEDQKELFPLCQIANYISPLHKHTRKMYTDYILLSKSVQKAIMALNDIPYFEFLNGWEYSYLELFRSDIKKLKLIDESDLLYDGGKYFHRAKDYAANEVFNPDPAIFPAIPNSFLCGRTEMNLIYYLDEYLYYRDNEEVRSKLPAEPPFEWMIIHLDLRSCQEEQITYWMCLFIYSACHVITRYYARKNPETIEFYVPNPEYIEYMEDYYFAALMALYNIYN